MDRRAFELVEPLDPEAAVARAGREHDRRACTRSPVASCDVARVVAAFELHRFVGDRDLDPELLRLAERAAHQRHARNAGREAEVILDPRRGAGLAAERAAIDRQHRQAFGRRHRPRWRARPARRRHDHVVEPVGVDRPTSPTQRAELVLARVAQQLAGRTEDDRQLFGLDLEALDQRLSRSCRSPGRAAGRDGRCGAGN